MRLLKKYPNRRLYDTQTSSYVTLVDLRRLVLEQERVRVVDSRTGRDLTRSVLLQVIAEQEQEGHEPLLTDRVLHQLIRFYGDSMQGVLARFLEHSVMSFLAQSELYQRRMRGVLKVTPWRMMQRLSEENLAFWHGLWRGETAGPQSEADASFEPADGESPAHKPAAPRPGDAAKNPEAAHPEDDAPPGRHT